MSSENQEVPKKSFLVFFKENRSRFLLIFIIIVLGLLIVIGLNEFNKKKSLKISQDFNKAKILIEKKENNQALNILESIILEKDKFYSPSSLNLIIDNELLKDKDKILSYYDEIISNSKLDNNTKNLFIFKKIIVKDLILLLSVGIHQFEKLKRQKVKFNIEITTDPNLKSDIKSIVNYESVINDIKKLTKKSHFELLESLSESIFDRIFRNKKIKKIKLKIEKLEIIKETTSVGIEVTKTKI